MIESDAHRKQSTWFRNTGRGGSLTWFLQRATGLFIVLMILFHFGINHLVGGGEVTYEVVYNRLSHPLYKVLEMSFLTFALYHGLAGLWVVAADYVKNEGWRMLVFGALILAGAVLFLLGSYTIITFPIHEPAEAALHFLRDALSPGGVC